MSDAMTPRDRVVQAAPAPAPAGTPTDEELRDVYWNATDDGTGRISAERLAEIREQHAMDYAEYTRRAERQSWRDEVRPHPMDSGYFIDAHHARGALLAEVDRLTAALAAAERDLQEKLAGARIVMAAFDACARELETAKAERLLLARHVVDNFDGSIFGVFACLGNQAAAREAIDTARRIVAEAEAAARGGAEGGGDG